MRVEAKLGKEKTADRQWGLLEHACWRYLTFSHVPYLARLVLVLCTTMRQCKYEKVHCALHLPVGHS